MLTYKEPDLYFVVTTSPNGNPSLVRVGTDDPKRATWVLSDWAGHQSWCTWDPEWVILKQYHASEDCAKILFFRDFPLKPQEMTISENRGWISPFGEFYYTGWDPFLGACHIATSTYGKVFPREKWEKVGPGRWVPEHPGANFLLGYGWVLFPTSSEDYDRSTEFQRNTIDSYVDKRRETYGGWRPPKEKFAKKQHIVESNIPAESGWLSPTGEFYSCKYGEHGTAIAELGLTGCYDAEICGWAHIGEGKWIFPERGITEDQVREVEVWCSYKAERDVADVRRYIEKYGPLM